MALINCSKCGKPVSDRAVKCPHCGAKVHTSTTKPIISKETLLRCIVFLLLAVGAVVTYYQSPFVHHCMFAFHPWVHTEDLWTNLGVRQTLGTTLGQAIAVLPLACGLLCLGLLVYGIVRTLMKKPCFPRYKLWATIVVIAFPLICWALIAFYLSNVKAKYTHMLEQKYTAAKGTYTWEPKSTDMPFSFSLCEDGRIIYDGVKGYINEIEYDFDSDEFLFKATLKGMFGNNYHIHGTLGGNLTEKFATLTRLHQNESSYSTSCYDDCRDLMPDGESTVPLKKISDEVYKYEKEEE